MSPALIEAAAGTQLVIHELFQASDALLRENPLIARGNDGFVCGALSWISSHSLSRGLLSPTA